MKMEAEERKQRARTRARGTAINPIRFRVGMPFGRGVLDRSQREGIRLRCDNGRLSRSRGHPSLTHRRANRDNGQSTSTHLRPNRCHVRAIRTHVQVNRSLCTTQPNTWPVDLMHTYKVPETMYKLGCAECFRAAHTYKVIEHNVQTARIVENPDRIQRTNDPIRMYKSIEYMSRLIETMV